MKILFCCHYPRIKTYFCDISRYLAGYETDVIELQKIEQNGRLAKYHGAIPWHSLWQIAQLIERGHRVRRGNFHPRSYWRWLSLSAFRRSLKLFRAYSSIILDKAPDAVCVWGAKYRAALLALAARTQQVTVIYLENGVLPQTTAVDLQGINADNSLPRDAAFYRALAAPAVRETGTPLEVRKAIPGKHGQDSGLAVLPERYIFAPFQDDSDTQILLYSPWIKDMRQFFNLLVRTCKQLDDPQLHLLFKEHPSATSVYPDLHRKALGESRVHIVNNYLTQELIEHAETVVTINSSVGIESLLFDRPVIVTGHAFYSVPGLVMQADSETELLDRLRTARTFRSDPLLRRNFLHYLEAQFLVPGKKLSGDESHLRAMAARISALLQNQAA